jgi:hypothetical protein
MAARTKSKMAGEMIAFSQAKEGDTLLIGGEPRPVEAVEPHDLDAYLVIYAGGRRWVRSIFSTVVRLP